MMASGKKECGILKVDASLQTVMSTWDSTDSVKNMEMVFYRQLTKKVLLLYIPETLKMITYKVKVNYNNQTVSVTQEAG